MRKYFLIAGCAALMLSSWMPIANADDNMMGKFGGRDGLQKVVDDSVDLWAKDPRIAKNFDNANLAHLKAMLGEQFCELLGGGCKYAGLDMKTAHTGRNLKNSDFNFLAEDLQIVMSQHDVPFWAQNKLVAQLASMQRDVVTR
jgi:hemoglobin